MLGPPTSWWDLERFRRLLNQCDRFMVGPVGHVSLLRFIGWCLKQRRTLPWDRDHIWLYRQLGSGRVIGFVRVHPANLSPGPYKRWVLSYGLAESCRGQGHGKRMLSELLFLYDQVEFVAEAQDTNTPSIRLLRGLGFHLAGRGTGVVQFRLEKA